jgi:hypothetical protein
MILIGGLIMLFVVVFLVSNPQEIFSSTSFIDTELSSSTGLEVPVRTRMDLGSRRFLEDFPTQIGDWHGYDLDAEYVKEQSGADVALLRTYVKDTLSQPVWLVVMYSGNAASFHPPPICYPALGYQIEEQGRDLVNVKDISWLERSGDVDVSVLPDWVREAVKDIPVSEIGYLVSVKRLVIIKQENGQITDRRVVLYFYVKSKALSPEIGMIRGSALAPLSGSYDDSLDVVKELMSEAIPRLFEPRDPGNLFITSIAVWGIKGYLLILLLLAVPGTMIGYPIIMYMRLRKQGKAEEEEKEPDNLPSQS